MSALPISYEEFKRLPTTRSLDERVRDHIESLKKPSYLLELCRRYVEKEKRDAVYVLVLEYAQHHSESPKCFRLAVEHFLRVWNASYYRNNPGVDASLASDLEQLYESAGRELEALRQKRLGSLSSEDRLSAQKLFKDFGERQSIGWTGASKALHMAAPQALMMWDTGIRNAYHKLHKHAMGKMEQCYLEFMEQSNQLATEILSKSNEPDLSRSHPSYTEFEFRKTLAKMIDECNYIEFSWKERKPAAS